MPKKFPLMVTPGLIVSLISCGIDIPPIKAYGLVVSLKTVSSFNKPKLIILLSSIVIDMFYF